MSEKSNIDRLFQEKFKDFEAVPSDKVWASIQNRMDMKDKKTTLLPFWLRLCSFSAVFLIGFSVATTFIAGPFGITNPFTTTEESNSSTEEATVTDKNQESKNNNVSDSFENISKENDAVVSNTNGTDVANANDVVVSNTNDADASNADNTVVSNSIMRPGKNAEEKNTSNTFSTKSSVKGNYTDKALNTVSDNAKSDTKNKTPFGKSKVKAATVVSENSVALNTKNTGEKNTQTAIEKIATEKTATEKNNDLSAKNDSSIKNNNAVVSLVNPTDEKSGNVLTAKSDSSVKADKTVFDKNQTVTKNESQLAEDDKNLHNSDSDSHLNNAISKVAYESGNRHVSGKNEIVSNNAGDGKNTDALNKGLKNEMTNEKLVTDNNASGKATEKGVSTVVDSLASNKNKIAEEETDKKAEEEKEAKDKKEKASKWIVSTSFSPVYMNLNGSGSTLDSKFAENSKSYQTSMSYGVGLKYALNNKLTVRTGVNVLNFEYNTNGINYYYSNHDAGLEHVDENGNGSGIVITNPDPKNIAYDDDGMVTTRHNGSINHKINYMEVPLELSYKILNKKFGIDVIGGVSTLFLNDNKVSVVSKESNVNIGEANNLNKMHFSTNVGLGLRYNLLKELQVNVEPMFKYQINTYSGDSGNFKPYFMGVYSGISYKF
jgi:outer membrane protein with beta-barrel domain